MSRCHCKCKKVCKHSCEPMYMQPTYVEPAYTAPNYVSPAYAGPGCGNQGILGAGKGCCSFSCFIILILILLQFNGERRGHCDDDCSLGGRERGIDKGIIFIIALYYLSCCSPCA